MNAIFEILLRSNFRCGRMFYSRTRYIVDQPPKPSLPLRPILCTAALPSLHYAKWSGTLFEVNQL